MTILGYWAAPHCESPTRSSSSIRSGPAPSDMPGRRRSARASRILAVRAGGRRRRRLSVCGGRAGTAAEHGIDAKLLIVDDGGYGILREYQREAFGETTAVELPGKTWSRRGRVRGAVRSATPDDLGEQLAWAFARPGPAVVVLRALLTAAAPTP